VEGEARGRACLEAVAPELSAIARANGIDAVRVRLQRPLFDGLRARDGVDHTVDELRVVPASVGRAGAAPGERAVAAAHAIECAGVIRRGWVERCQRND